MGFYFLKSHHINTQFPWTPSCHIQNISSDNSQTKGTTLSFKKTVILNLLEMENTTENVSRKYTTVLLFP